MSKGELASFVDAAAHICKADLVTGLVGEFPELQGVIGGHLARAQGEPDAIADAVRDHYRPVGQGDEVPTAPVTVAVSLADKLDSLFSFFAAGMLPSGSKDPFALRRSAIASIRLIEENALRAYVSEIARFWNGGTTTGPGQQVEDFMHDRLGVSMRDEGRRYDLVQASTTLNSRLDGDLWRVRRRALALQKFVETGEGANLLAGYKRASNILRKEEGSWTPDQIGGDGVVSGEEAALADALDAAGPTATAAVEAEDFTAAMSALASLRAPIDAFFDAAMINDPDAGIRARRLNLLARFRDAVHAVADFSKIEG
jgi:glycyl-tRNA synthetase beta chain